MEEQAFVFCGENVCLLVCQILDGTLLPFILTRRLNHRLMQGNDPSIRLGMNKISSRK